MSTTEMQDRLQGPMAQELVRLVADWILERPLVKIFAPSFVADQVVMGLEVVAKGDQLEHWVKAQLDLLRTRVPSGVLAEQLPQELTSSIEEVMVRHYTPDQSLVLALIDHATMQNLVREILNQTMRSFTQKLKAVTPSMSRTPSKTSRGLGRIGSLGQSVLGGIGSEISQRTETLASQTVDEALRLTIPQVAEHIADPQNAESYAAFRLHIWRTLMATKNEDLAQEWDKLDPEGLVAATTAASRALARREGLRGEIMALTQALLDNMNGRCLRDLLQEAGLDPTEHPWRETMETQLATHVRDFVSTPKFSDWLATLVSDNGDRT